jgi:hypothetical protein
MWGELLWVVPVKLHEGGVGRKMGAGRLPKGIYMFLPPCFRQPSECATSTVRRGLDWQASFNTSRGAVGGKVSHVVGENPSGRKEG